MDSEIILTYKIAVPDQIKHLVERAIQITFEGGKIEWISDKKVIITKIGVEKIYVNK
jgi:hypothetical protein